MTICGLLLAIGTAAAPAGAQPFHAGVAHITVRDSAAFDTLIAYPTAVAEAIVADGHYTLRASRDAPVASGPRFPLVLFSHGSGRGPGTPLIHRGLLLHLARAGFVVIAPFHPGARIGIIGFSFGGAVTLIAAGAKADLAHLAAYCKGRRDDPRACDGIPTDGSLDNVPSRASPDALPLKALVLLEPFGALFTRDDLADLTMPVAIYHALQSDLRADGNALAIAAALPRPPQQHAMPGGHFVFVDPCPLAIAVEAPQACKDPPGVDRAAIHRSFEREIATFLRDHL